jgi:hypothetical protein
MGAEVLHVEKCSDMGDVFNVLKLEHLVLPKQQMDCCCLGLMLKEADEVILNAERDKELMSQPDVLCATGEHNGSNLQVQF